MKVSKIKSLIRVFLEALFSALLFGLQGFLSVGSGIFTMSVPLLPMALFLLVHPENIPMAWSDFLWYFFYGGYIIARIFVYIGLTLLIVAAGQWIRYHFKKVGLFTKGIYGKVRHPQFLGIITISTGFTIWVATYGHYHFIIPGTSINGSLPFAVGMWFIQALGYMALAKFEERRLSKKFGQEYQEYKQKTPMLFPIKNRTKYSETKFTIIILLIICAILLFVPFNQIGGILGHYIPDWRFT